jgi:drug/metabolite transporter (DMT)-like permease
MRRTRTVLANDSLLLLTAVIWGMAFVAQRMGMEHIGPFTYNAVRFALGALSLVPLILVRRARTHGAGGPARAAAAPAPAAGGFAGGAAPVGSLAAGLLAGGVLFVGASLQQIGLVFTTAGKAGFITGLYVVLVPLAGLLWGQRAGWSAWAGAVLSVAGLFLLSVTAAFAIERGDLFVLVGAFFWAAHVQVVGWLSPRTDPVKLSCVQFAVCSLASAGGTLLSERVVPAGILAAAWPIVYGGVLSVGIAYTLQVVAQRRAPPAHAAILLSLESVFAAIGGGLVLGERLGARGVAGCAIMFAGMILSQVPLIAASLAGNGLSPRSRRQRPGSPAKSGRNRHN